MEVIAKIIDQDGKEYYYPKTESVAHMRNVWRIPTITPNALMMAKVLNDSSEEILFLDHYATAHNCRIELKPTQEILSTYLSTYTKAIEISAKIIYVYLVIIPLILSILLYLSVSN